jgi:hypothetical protein
VSDVLYLRPTTAHDKWLILRWTDSSLALVPDDGAGGIVVPFSWNKHGGRWSDLASWLANLRLSRRECVAIGAYFRRHLGHVPFLPARPRRRPTLKSAQSPDMVALEEALLSGAWLRKYSSRQGLEYSITPGIDVEALASIPIFPELLAPSQAYGWEFA